jgi:hypothetical protein
MLFVLDVGLRTLFQSSADFAFLVTSRLLIRHVNVMERLRHEIASVMEGGQLPTRDQIRKMPYLACVIKESGSEQFGLFLGSSRLYSPIRSSSLSSCSAEQSGSGTNHSSTNRGRSGRKQTNVGKERRTRRVFAVCEFTKEKHIRF